MPFLFRSPTLFHARYYARCQNQIAMNNYFYTAIENPDVDTDESSSVVLAALDARAQLFYPDVLSVDAEYYTTSIQDVVFQPGTGTWKYEHVEQFATPSFLDGTEDSDVLPKQTCGLIRKRSVFSGRGNSGRIYVPFPGIGVNVDGAPTAPYLAKLQALADGLAPNPSLAIGVGNFSLVPVIFDPTRITVLGMTAVTTTTCAAKWATQRKRGDFGAPNILPG